MPDELFFIPSTGNITSARPTAVPFHTPAKVEKKKKMMKKRREKMRINEEKLWRDARPEH